MLKKGFTLQELLITMAIIGVVAAITAPAIQKLIPNEQKLKYMKAYNAVTSITNDIAGDSSLYWTDYDHNGDATCIGLSCFNDTSESFTRLTAAHPELLASNGGILGKVQYGNSVGINNYNDWTAVYSEPKKCVAKFMYLFASKLNLQSNVVCEDVGINSGMTCEFTTTDGTSWTIFNNNNNNKYTHTITVDTNNNGSSTNTETGFNNGTPKNIDTFTFDISSEGNVSIPNSEYLAKEFLKNPTDMHNASKENSNAKAAYDAKIAADKAAAEKAAAAEAEAEGGN